MNTKNEDYMRQVTRLTKLKADKEELKLKVMRSELVKVADVRKEWQENASRVRTKILALPEIAPSLSMLTIAEMKAVLLRKVNEILNELASEYR